MNDASITAGNYESSGMDLSPETTVEQVIQRYPLTIQFFQRHSDKELLDLRNGKVTVKEFAQWNQWSVRQFENNLRDHLGSITRPDSEECEDNLCYVLLFCPTELLKKLRRWIGF